MHRDDYQLIANSELRNVIRSVVADPRDLPTKSVLRAQIVEACPPGTDAKVVDAILTKCAEFAQAAVDPGARWDLRASADALTLHVLKAYQESERLIPGANQDEEPIDAKGVVDGLEMPWEKNMRAIENAHKAAELEANLARQIGGQA